MVNQKVLAYLNQMKQTSQKRINLSDDIKKKVLLVVDNGLFFEFALKLADYFGKVYYYNEWKNSYPSMVDLAVADTQELLGNLIGYLKSNEVMPVANVTIAPVYVMPLC